MAFVMAFDAKAHLAELFDGSAAAASDKGHRQNSRTEKNRTRGATSCVRLSRQQRPLLYCFKRARQQNFKLARKDRQLKCLQEYPKMYVHAPRGASCAPNR